MFISLPLQIKCVKKLLQDMQSSLGSRAEEHTAGLPWTTTRSKIFKHLQMVKNQTVVGNTYLKGVQMGQGWPVSPLWAMWHMSDSSGVPTLQESPVQELLDHLNLCLQKKGCLHCQTAMRASNPPWGSGYHRRHLQLLFIFSILSLLRLLIQGQEVGAFGMTLSALFIDQSCLTSPANLTTPSCHGWATASWLSSVSGKNVTTKYRPVGALVSPALCRLRAPDKPTTAPAKAHAS